MKLITKQGPRSYETARFFAISAIGYGRGFTEEEALENYVKIQLQSIPVKSTIFKTKRQWEAALRTGDARPQIWQAPEGWNGFTYGWDGLMWKREVDGKTEHRKAQIQELVRNNINEEDLS